MSVASNAETAPSNRRQDPAEPRSWTPCLCALQFAMALTCLNLGFSGAVNDESVQRLALMSQLQVLSLNGCINLGDDGEALHQKCHTQDCCSDTAASDRTVSSAVAESVCAPLLQGLKRCCRWSTCGS